MSNRAAIALAAVIALVVGVVVLVIALNRPDDRFGDPEVLEQIEDANCGELREWSDEFLRVAADPDHTDEELNRAVRYSNVADERMAELDCFEK